MRIETNYKNAFCLIIIIKAIKASAIYKIQITISPISNIRIISEIKKIGHDPKEHEQTVR